MKTPFQDEAAILVINILMNKCSISNKDSSRKYAQEALKYLFALEDNDLPVMKYKFKLFGLAAGNEDLFKDLIPESIDASTDIEELTVEIFIQAIIKMGETIYHYGEENQNLREKVSRLEAELASNHRPNNTELPSYANHSAAASMTSTISITETETEPKDELKSFKP
jgi:hypothetical protein